MENPAEYIQVGCGNEVRIISKENFEILVDDYCKNEFQREELDDISVSGCYYAFDTVKGEWISIDVEREHKKYKAIKRLIQQVIE